MVKRAKKHFHLTDQILAMARISIVSNDNKKGRSKIEIFTDVRYYQIILILLIFLFYISIFFLLYLIRNSE